MQKRSLPRPVAYKVQGDLGGRGERDAQGWADPQAGDSGFI